MFKCYTGTIYRASVEKERQSEMSCLLSFIVITLFTAGIQIGMLAIFSVASSFLFPVQANAGFVCQLHVINHSSPEGASFLSVHRNERIPYFLCHPQHVDFRLKKKKKLTVILLRFVGTLVAGVVVGAPLSHNDTLVGTAPPRACVVLNLLTRDSWEGG